MEELRGNLSDLIRESCREHQSLSRALQLLEGYDANFWREKNKIKRSKYWAQIPTLAGMLGSLTILLTSGMKPMSSILSASSSTRYFTAWNPIFFCFTKSSNLQSEFSNKNLKKCFPFQGWEYSNFLPSRGGNE